MTVNTKTLNVDLTIDSDSDSTIINNAINGGGGVEPP